MSFHGPQGAGAQRRAREQRRTEAEARAALRCPTGKVRYPTEHDAQCALVGAVIGRNRGRQQRRETRVYACPYCAGHHLTSRPERKSA